MNRPNDEIMQGYRIGEAERIALANSNSELRSQLLETRQALEQAYYELQRLTDTMLTNNEPSDWDGVSYCTNLCGTPATHRKLLTFSGETPVVELVCCSCSKGS